MLAFSLFPMALRRWVWSECPSWNLFGNKIRGKCKNS